MHSLESPSATSAFSRPRSRTRTAIAAAALLIGILSVTRDGTGASVWRAALQQSPPHAAAPEVSPDGKLLLAVSAGTAPGSFTGLIINPDGSTRHSFPGGRGVSWFPDSKRVLVLQGGSASTPGALMIMNADGTDAHAIPTPGLNVGAAKVLGSGDVILFADITRDPVRRLITWRWNSIGVDGSRRVPLPVAPPTGSLVGANVVPSHDGKRIAFLTIDTTNMSASEKVHQSTLFTMNLDGTNVRRIATLQEDASGLSWSPDDRFLAAADNFTPHPVPANFVGDGTIVRIDLANGAVVPLMHHDRRYLDEHPSWSTDGHIYFQSNRDGVTDIYRMAADGSNPERITRPK